MPFIVREVVLEDFISHERTALRLGPGITVFIGENGAGKSSIVDAIYYALTLPTRQAVRGGKANLVRRGSKRGRATVRLVLEDTRTGNELEIRAEIDGRQGRSSSVEVYLRSPEEKAQGKRGRLVARKVDAARREVARALGMDPESFDDVVPRVVVLRQGMLAQTISLFASGKAREKREFLSRLFGLESYRRAVERMRDLEIEVEGRKVRSADERTLRDFLQRTIRDIAAKRKQREEILSSLEELRSSLEEAQARLTEREAVASELKSLLDKAKESLSTIEGTLRETRSALKEKLDAKKMYESLACPSIEERLAGLREKITRLESLADKIAALEADLERARSELSNAEKAYSEAQERYEAVKRAIELFGGKHPSLVIDEINRLTREISRLSTRLADLVQAKNQITKQLNAARRKAAEVAKLIGEEGLDPEEALERAREKLETLRAEAGELRRKAGELARQEASLLSRAEDLEEKARILSGAEGRCPVCGSELPHDRAGRLAAGMLRQARELREKARKARLMAEEASEKADRLEEEANRLASALARLEEAFEGLQEYGGYREAVKKLEEIEDKLADLRVRIQSLQEELERLESLKEEAIRLSGILSRHGIIGETISGEMLRRLEEDLRKAVGALEEARKRVQDMEKALRDLLETAGSLAGRRVGSAAEARGALAELRESLRGLETAAGECKRLAGVLQGLEELQMKVARLEEAKQKAEARVKDLEDKLGEANERLEEARSAVEGLREQITAKKAALASVESDLERLESERAGLEKMVWAARVLATVRAVLERAPEVLYQRKLALLEDMASRVLASFNTKYVEIRAVRDGDDLRFVLSSREGTSADLAMLSGGEQTAFGLALVIGLNKLLAGDIGFLVLDEPTAHLDQEKRRMIAEILRDLKSEAHGIVDQIIIVSHEPQLIDAADAVYRVSYENGRSVVREEAPTGLPL